MVQPLSELLQRTLLKQGGDVDATVSEMRLNAASNGALAALEPLLLHVQWRSEAGEAVSDAAMKTTTAVLRLAEIWGKDPSGALWCVMTASLGRSVDQRVDMYSERWAVLPAFEATVSTLCAPVLVAKSPRIFRFWRMDSPTAFVKHPARRKGSTAFFDVKSFVRDFCDRPLTFPVVPQSTRRLNGDGIDRTQGHLPRAAGVRFAGPPAHGVEPGDDLLRHSGARGGGGGGAGGAQPAAARAAAAACAVCAARPGVLAGAAVCAAGAWQMAKTHTLSFVKLVFCTQEGRRNVHKGVLFFDVSHTPSPLSSVAFERSVEAFAALLVFAVAVPVSRVTRLVGARATAGYIPSAGASSNSTLAEHRAPPCSLTAAALHAQDSESEVRKTGRWLLERAVLHAAAVEEPVVAGLAQRWSEWMVLYDTLDHFAAYLVEAAWSTLDSLHPSAGWALPVCLPADATPER